MPATYEPISTTTLGSAASTITFSSIPATYTDLRLVIVAKGAGTQPTLRFRFNGNTSTLYSSIALYGDGAAAGTSSQVNDVILLAGISQMNSTQSELVTIDVFSYAQSINKTVLVSRSQDLNGSGYVERYVGLFRSTTAISSIDLLANYFNAGGQFASGTIATLYGIKAA